MSTQELDLTWLALRAQALALRGHEVMLRPLLDRAVLARTDLADGLAHLLAGKLSTDEVPSGPLAGVLRQAYTAGDATLVATRRDLSAIVERDPLTRDFLNAFLFHKGFQTLQAHRAIHALWAGGRQGLACFLQGRLSEVFAVDIHPAARIGAGVFLDNATGVSLDATAVVDDGASMRRPPLPLPLTSPLTACTP